MFTGIVEEIGKILHVIDTHLGKRFYIQAARVLIGVKVGDSIAVNGTCLTVVEFDQKGFWVDVVAETLRCTNLGLLATNGRVNLEAALTLQKPLGGHLMQGHIDGTGKILSIESEGDARLLKISFPKKIRPYLVNKGFIAIDGMSLTVIDVTDEYFTLTLIPHTQEVSIAGGYRVGQQVNLEGDIMAKYAENFYRYGSK
jgi:riboflavin synthase